MIKSNETAPKVPFLDKFRNNNVLERVLYKMDRFELMFPTLLGGDKSHLPTSPWNAIGGGYVQSDGEVGAEPELREIIGGPCKSKTPPEAEKNFVISSA